MYSKILVSNKDAGKGFVVPTCTMMMKNSSLKLIMDEDVGCIKTSHAFILNNMDLQNQNHVNIRSNLSCVDLHIEMKKPDAICYDDDLLSSRRSFYNGLSRKQIITLLYGLNNITYDLYKFQIIEIIFQEG